jgi:hypothetical protein
MLTAGSALAQKKYGLGVTDTETDCPVMRQPAE